jgi:hypothetical protein
VSQNPPGRVGITASDDDAEGATTPESLRQPDRSGEATLESSRHARLAEGESPVRVKLSGIDDSGGQSITLEAS